MLVSICMSLLYLTMWYVISKRFPGYAIIIGPGYIFLHSVLVNLAARNAMPFGIETDSDMEMMDFHLLGIYMMTSLLAQYSFVQSLCFNTPIFIIATQFYNQARFTDSEEEAA